MNAEAYFEGKACSLIIAPCIHHTTSWLGPSSWYDADPMHAVQTQDLDKAWLMRKECRAKVNAEATPEAMHAAFQRLFPMPCRSRYIALCLLPQQPLLARLVCCPCCLFPYAFLIPYPQLWPLLL